MKSGNLTSDKEYEFDDKVLREPAAYSGFAYSTFWDKEEDEDPANNVGKVYYSPY